MHKHVTHNKCYATFTQFADAMLSFLRDEVPRNCASLRDSVTDNFRVISPISGYGVNGVYAEPRYVFFRVTALPRRLTSCSFLKRVSCISAGTHRYRKH